MASNPLEQAQKSGIRAVNDLGVLIGRLGTTAHPNSQTLVAYRNANRALRDVIKNGGKVSDAREITSQLKFTVKSHIHSVFRDAAGHGYKNAAQQLTYYNTNPPDMPEMAMEIGSAYAVIDTTLQKQEAALSAMLISGTDENIILGDGTRPGVLRPAEVVMVAAFWVSSLWWGTFDNTVSHMGGKFQKQAIAAIDNRTTDCCLRVHGQVQPLNAPFHLDGVPRYANQVDWPPFHNWCRTSGVLYLAEYDDGLTDQMSSDAQAVLDERVAGVNKNRHPADAFA